MNVKCENEELEKKLQMIFDEMEKNISSFMKNINMKEFWMDITGNTWKFQKPALKKLTNLRLSMEMN